MSDREDGTGRPFEAAKAVVGAIEVQRDGNLVTPFRKNLIITTNGQLHQIITDAFSPTIERLLELWNADATQFTKIET